MTVRKYKVSLSLPADLVEWVDRQARRKRGETRSGVVERALRAWTRQSAAREIENATVAYYQALTREERDEDAAWSSLGEDAFRE